MTSDSLPIKLSHIIRIFFSLFILIADRPLDVTTVVRMDLILLLKWADIQTACVANPPLISTNYSIPLGG